jgi:hypothetical protein
MPGTLDRSKGFPAIAGSAINPGAVVKPAAGSEERRMVPIVATSSEFAFGVIDTRAASAAVGEAVTVFEPGAVVEGLAAASLGAAAEVAVASVNGGFAPVVGASGVVRNSVGVALTPAAPGEYFALYIRPRALSGGA